MNVYSSQKIYNKRCQIIQYNLSCLIQQLYYSNAVFVWICDQANKLKSLLGETTVENMTSKGLKER